MTTSPFFHRALPGADDAPRGRWLKACVVALFVAVFPAVVGTALGAAAAAPPAADHGAPSAKAVPAAHGAEHGSEEAAAGHGKPGDAAGHGAAPASTATNINFLAPPEPPPGVSRAEQQARITLDSERKALSTTNVARRFLDLGNEARSAKWTALLKEARLHREARAYSAAREDLVELLESAAPEDLKRPALLELALIAVDERDFAKAQQIFAHYQKRYPEDLSIPEIFLRQGRLYREMGVPNLALSKFYSVMSSSLNLKQDQMPYYKSLALQAMTEIADTHFAQGQFSEAVRFLERVLKMDDKDLNRPALHFKLIQSLYNLGSSVPARNTEVVSQCRFFLANFTNDVQVPEVRFLLADAYRRLGQHNDAKLATLELLQSQSSTNASPEQQQTWIYWQQRTGNDIGNQLYREGDYANALDVYVALVGLNTSAAWQVPVLYQIGLVFERMDYMPKALEAYEQILKREKEIMAYKPPPGLSAIIDMARFRKQNIEWQTATATTKAQLFPKTSTNAPKPPDPPPTQ